MSLYISMPLALENNTASVRALRLTVKADTIEEAVKNLKEEIKSKFSISRLSVSVEDTDKGPQLVVAHHDSIHQKILELEPTPFEKPKRKSLLEEPSALDIVLAGYPDPAK